MTTGRINQVAFLGDNTTRRSPSPKNSSSGAETGEEVNLIEHKQLEKAVERAEAPMPASRSASESTSDRTWSSSARVCSTGTRARCQDSAPGASRHEPSRDPRRWRSTSGTSAGPPACKLKQLPLRPGRQPRCGARWGCRTSARARQMNATPSPRRSSPSGPDSLAGDPEAVAGNGSSPAGNGSPLAGKRVIDNSNTSGHVPQHARQLFERPGDGGRSRVFACRKRVSSPAGNGSLLAGKRVIDNSNTSGHVPQHARQLFRGSGDGGRSRVFAGRKSGVRWPEIGSSIPGLHIGPSTPPTYSPLHSSPTPLTGPWAPATWPAPRPGRGHPPKEQ
ncbi:hypothetical protein OIU74_005797 [Salix koriyanagi]|uniref:Uncharacterized protein n=1 Tax=Salix koriyanagi TaxID=2511006 RepID=A0A9Q0NUC4_9ROSI|nr:hypothetical protein OIU74_005797 [Salix koriyanagi]